MASLSSTAAPRARAAPAIVLRHSILVRVCHWVNALCFFDPADERPADLQRPSLAELGQGDEFRTTPSSPSRRRKTTTAT